MNLIDTIMDLFLIEFKKEYGDDAQIENGEKYSILLNDGIAIISYDDGKISIDIIAGEPYRIDFDMGL